MNIFRTDKVKKYIFEIHHLIYYTMYSTQYAVCIKYLVVREKRNLNKKLFITNLLQTILTILKTQV